MINRTILLGIMIVAVGMIALPQTFALFAGQHTWNDIGYMENGEVCKKCHSDIAIEIEQSPIHGAWGKDCVGCHIATPAGYASGPFKSPANRTMDGSHAATTVRCAECHSGVAVDAYSASNFNTTTNTWKSHKNSLGSPNEAHKSFAMQSASNMPIYNDNGTIDTRFSAGQGNIMLRGDDVSCVACHTHTKVVITWTRPTGMSFDANSTSSGWVTSNYQTLSTTNTTITGEN